MTSTAEQFNSAEETTPLSTQPSLKTWNKPSLQELDLQATESAISSLELDGTGPFREDPASSGS